MTKEEFKRISRKIKTLDELEKIVGKEKSEVVLTNGCFSYIHYGHLHYLMSCKEEKKKLIVCINSDESIKGLKGYEIFMPEHDRAMTIASMSFVDYVYIFSTKDVTDILTKLHPQVYTKGGDYTLDTINQLEREIIEKYGGEIKFTPKVDGYSTKEYIKEMRKIDLNDKK